MKYSSYITLGDIAKLANVSIVTVSKALKGYPDISEETSKKIKRIAQELGYVPNYFARNISSKQSKVIGVILPNISYSFFLPILDTMYQIAYENDYEIILKISHGDAFYEKKLIESLLSMRVDGIIISVTSGNKDIAILRQVKRLGVALTLMNNVKDNYEFNKVTIDNYESAFAATNYALSLNYKKLVYFSGPDDDLNALEGFKSALIRHDISVDSNTVINCVDDNKSGYYSFIKLNESRKIPECIFCADFPTLMGILKAINDVGLKIPDDLDLIASGYYSAELLPVQPLVYVQPQIREYSQRTFEMTIKSLIEKASPVPQEINLPSSLIYRNETLNSEQNNDKNYYNYRNAGGYF